MDDNHFKVGDRVRAARDCTANGFKIEEGKEYTVTGASSGTSMLQLDDAYRYASHPAYEFELVRSAEELEREELAELRAQTSLSVEQITRLSELLTKYWTKAEKPAPAVEEEPATKPGAVGYVEILTFGGQTSNYLIDLAEVSTRTELIQSLEYLLHSSKFIKVTDKAGTEKLIAVDTIEEARVL